ncbi:uncharacterized protein LDX57_000979 [Aspergillus melleus]|uniref:uncharacterized protein n=1 Tax=Aspergillus melleus TaxID=138277 RepID=UPI001E8D3FCF|nr:uncharacterized protein LDX57_000979 [Aspergillus melleus]KAH8423223.1 hypothetical protein LDX57_000979 [Aspergillus melleus]
MSAFSIDEAMADALENLNRISCHFRKHEQHNAANEVGKLSVQIVNAFSDGIENLSRDEYIFSDAEGKDCQSIDAGLSSNHVSEALQRHSFSGLLTQIERMTKANVGSHVNMLQKVSSDEILPHQQQQQQQ